MSQHISFIAAATSGLLQACLTEMIVPVVIPSIL